MAQEMKDRRKVGLSKAQPRSYSELYGAKPVGSEAPVATPTRRPKPETENATPQRGSDSVDWKNEYKQVFGDLRQLLGISALLFALMVVLGFVL